MDVTALQKVRQLTKKYIEKQVSKDWGIKSLVLKGLKLRA
jgi:hypothetical protein